MLIKNYFIIVYDVFLIFLDRSISFQVDETNFIIETLRDKNIHFKLYKNSLLAHQKKKIIIKL